MAKRIVIADDSATIQRAFAMTFGAEDVTLVAARSAEEGFALTRQLQPELVIADGMMPGRSGYDLCAQIKADPSLSSTAVYVLASAQQPYDDSRGRQCGADGHLMKPFDTTAIIERVHEALAKGPTEVAQPVSAPAPLSDDFGPPMPDMRSGIPHGLTTSLAAASDDDEYGEISVDMSPPPPEDDAPEAEVEYAAEPAAASRPSLTPPPYAPSAGTPSPSFQAPAASFQASAPAGASVPAAASMRPSLIPGIRPGAVAPARPGAAPPRPATPSPAPASRPPAPVARTLMGLPAANVPIPGTSRPTAPPMARPSPPSTPAPLSALGSPPASSPPSSSSVARPVPAAPPASTPAPLFAAVPAMPSTPLPAVAAAPSVSAMVSAAVGAAVDQKIAAIGARGPEYEAIAKLSREIIEQIVWEVVPELAEVIIREHVERHVRA
jgi:CheY-like chemotaxis protein